MIELVVPEMQMLLPLPPGKQTLRSQGRTLGQTLAFQVAVVYLRPLVVVGWELGVVAGQIEMATRVVPDLQLGPRQS